MLNLPSLNNQTDLSGLKLNCMGEGTTDDDFFHLICHIDSALKQKIEKGEYVDLDKLLPKEKSNPSSTLGDYDKLEWVHQNGNSFLVPAQRQSRITSFRRWEQAFRVYATIYCGANPNWAREVWQYISVINTATNAYVWDNVYHYDTIFRQLMQFNPTRSWAITYNHMWNLSMREPLQKIQGRVMQGGGFSSGSLSGSLGSKNGSAKKKNDYCWNFNKGIKCRFRKNVNL